MKRCSRPHQKYQSQIPN